MQVVAHLILFGFKIAGILLVGGNYNGYGLGDIDAMGVETDTFGWIVSDKSHVGGFKIFEYLGADAVVALVSFEAEFEISLHGVASEFLKMVGSEFVDEADTSTLLTHIEDKALTSLVDHLHSLMQLVSAVALAGTENIARSTRGVNADHDRLAFLPIALLKG